MGTGSIHLERDGKQSAAQSRNVDGGFAEHDALARIPIESDHPHRHGGCQPEVAHHSREGERLRHGGDFIRAGLQVLPPELEVDASGVAAHLEREYHQVVVAGFFADPPIRVDQEADLVFAGRQLAR